MTFHANSILFGLIILTFPLRYGKILGKVVDFVYQKFTTDLSKGVDRVMFRCYDLSKQASKQAA